MIDIESLLLFPTWYYLFCLFTIERCNIACYLVLDYMNRPCANMILFGDTI